ncbi:hypothetical protein J5N97_019978 [Dioscorea zingiberensis]|uniref:Origin recognition complex subunit 1 n=1 Tax=Dioscorea zingiberensis TaxID=325984 RepID=A0A9D5HD01_9LILI|nr:hypothetical protein J5N97_019978 [Dioscorea zingiberensis]
MEATPSKSRPKPSPPAPQTPGSGLRRSLRLLCTPRTPIYNSDPSSPPKPAKQSKRSLLESLSFSTITPNPPESKRRKKSGPDYKIPKRKIYFKKVVYDGGEFEIGDDVYVKRKEDVESDDNYLEVEECRICFEVGISVMVECDDCLGGFHLNCLKPPLNKVPEGDWFCGYCEARKMGKVAELPKPPEGKKFKRTTKEKLLSSDLWAARIESLWKEPDGSYWLRCRWYIIPEETAAGRQPHNLRRELYRTNDIGNIEMESVIRHCYVMNPKDFFEANNEGDDVFYCEYEYDIHWHSFKRLAEIDDSEENDEGAGNDDEWKVPKDSDSHTYEDSEKEEDTAMGTKCQPHQVAANSRRGRVFGLQRIGTKRIPEHVRSHKQTELERAKAMLLLATLPKSLPCRNKEMDEITAFVKGAIYGDQCLGQCLYIHGVPGTGKTMSVLSVMRNLRSEVDAGTMRPYCFIEINGLKLATPENTYKVIYEALSGHRVGWKKALHYLNERFSKGIKVGKQTNHSCVLLIDELDVLLRRNQSVLYNVLDWLARPHSKLVIIGIANTMNLPEKLLHNIGSRAKNKSLCFGPYNYQQLQEIILTRLEGSGAFEEQAIEFASRKVAAMSGDVRRALEICRCAAELADHRLKQLPPTKKMTNNDNSAGKCLVGMADVESAIQEVLQEPHISIMKTGSRLSKIMLVSMVHELYKSGLSEITFDKLAATVSSLCSSNREAIPGWDTLLKVGCKLGECGIILCEESTRHKLQKLQLNVESDDVAFALKDCPELPWLSKYL